MISSFELQAQNIEESFSSFFERFTSSHGNQTGVSKLSIYLNDKIPPIHELFDSLGISQLPQSLPQLDFTAQMLPLGVGLVIFLGALAKRKGTRKRCRQPHRSTNLFEMFSNSLAVI